MYMLNGLALEKPLLAGQGKTLLDHADLIFQEGPEDDLMATIPQRMLKWQICYGC